MLWSIGTQLPAQMMCRTIKIIWKACLWSCTNVIMVSLPVQKLSLLVLCMLIVVDWILAKRSYISPYLVVHMFCGVMEFEQLLIIPNSLLQLFEETY